MTQTQKIRYSKCISLKKKAVIDIDLLCFLEMYVCIFLNDSMWINHLQEDFLQHLLRNIIFSDTVGLFSWDSVTFSSNIHCLVRPENVNYRRLGILMFSLELQPGWSSGKEMPPLPNMLRLCEVGAELNNRLLSNGCMMMVLVWAAKDFRRFWSYGKADFVLTVSCNWSTCIFKSFSFNSEV